MPVNSRSKRISVSSCPGSDATIYHDANRRTSISQRVSFDERYLDDILTLRKSYNTNNITRRPNRISLKSIPTSYFATGKVAAKSSFGNNTKRSEGDSFESNLSDKKTSSASRASTADRDVLSRLSLYDPDNTGEYWIRKKKLRLPPVLLPPIYTIRPKTPECLEEVLDKPLRFPKPITDRDWSELQECRYLRPGLRKYRLDIRPRLKLT
ncbi:hypothetical protein LOTGIDRAFT_175276 [Lottia gigantea]|uniref:Uncharacterized protein n=1 Tax=Lottia gigantea TaxID=225164 RepID=V4C0G8_LOTGI|nr:hypothetical protein LOTGIDRAFT_175276 [Lottia gigantea]ESO94924.1 hypothetical protein LOTGIDRAFT_175276 [Lottia gigantea]